MKLHLRTFCGSTLVKTREVAAMTIFEVITTVISFVNLMADIILGVLGLKTGNKKK